MGSQRCSSGKARSDTSTATPKPGLAPDRSNPLSPVSAVGDALPALLLVGEALALAATGALAAAAIGVRGTAQFVLAAYLVVAAEVVVVSLALSHRELVSRWPWRRRSTRTPTPLARHGLERVQSRRRPSTTRGLSRAGGASSLPRSTGRALARCRRSGHGRCERSLGSANRRGDLSRSSLLGCRHRLGPQDPTAGG